MNELQRQLIEKYANNTYVGISLKELNNLRLSQIEKIVEILDTLKKEGDLEKTTQTTQKSNLLLKNEIIDIVIEYKKRGRPNKEIYFDPRLQNVKEYTIRGILAAYARGFIKIRK